MTLKRIKLVNIWERVNLTQPHVLVVYKFISQPIQMVNSSVAKGTLPHHTPRAVPH